MHWEDPEGWDGEGGGGRIGMGNTCKSMADSCQCMAKTTKYYKVISLQLIKINETNKQTNSISSLLWRTKENIKPHYTKNLSVCVLVALSFLL